MAQITVLLVGGPSGLSDLDRVRRVATLVDRIKLVIGNGYEHFAYAGESRDLDGSSLPVFRWCYQTKLAE